MNEAELERLVVRIVGDADEYVRTLQQAEKSTATAATKVEVQATRISTAMAKDSAAYEATAKAARTGELAATGVAKSQSAQASTAERLAIAIGTAANATKDAATATKAAETAATALSNKERELAAKLDAAAASAKANAAATKDAAKATDKAAEAADKLSERATKAAAAGAVMTASLGLLSKAALDSANKFEQTTLALQTTLGTAEEAKRTLADTAAISIKAPFDIQELEAATQALATFGERGEDLKRTLRTLGNAAAGAGAPLAEVTQAFNKVRSTNKLMGGEFELFSRTGVVSLMDIAEHLGVTEAAAMDMVESGKVGFSDLRAILTSLTSGTGRFSGAMERQAGTLKGSFAGVSNSVEQLSRTFGKELAPIAKEVAAVVTSVTRAISELPGWVKTTIAVVTSLGIALGVVLLVGGASVLLYKNLAAGLVAYVTRANAAAVATMGFKLAVGGLVTYGLYKLGQALLNINGDVTKFNEEMKRSAELTDAVVRAQSKMADSVAKKLNAITSPAARREAIAAELSRMRKEVSDRVRIMEGLRKQLAEAGSGPEFLARQFGARTSKELVQEQIDAQQKMLDVARRNAEALQDELSKFKPPEQDPELIRAIDEFNAKLKLQAETYGMTGDEIELYKLKLQGATDAMLKGVRVQARLNAEMEKRGKLKADFDELKAAIIAETETMGKSADAAKIYSLAIQGLTNEQIKQLDALAGAKAEKEAWLAMFEEGKQLTQEYLPVVDKFLARVEQLNKMAEAGAISEATYDKALAATRKQFEELTGAAKEAQAAIGKFDAAIVGTREAEDRIMEFRDKISMQLQGMAASTLPDVPRPTFPEPPKDPQSRESVPKDPFAAANAKENAEQTQLLSKAVTLLGSIRDKPNVTFRTPGLG